VNRLARRAGPKLPSLPVLGVRPAARAELPQLKPLLRLLLVLRRSIVARLAVVASHSNDDARFLPHRLTSLPRVWLAPRPTRTCCQPDNATDGHFAKQRRPSAPEQRNQRLLGGLVSQPSLLEPSPRIELGTPFLPRMCSAD